MSSIAIDVIIHVMFSNCNAIMIHVIYDSQR